MKILNNNPSFVRIQIAKNQRERKVLLIIFSLVLLMPPIWRNPINLMIAGSIWLIALLVYIWTVKNPVEIVFDREKQLLITKRHLIKLSEVKSIYLKHNIITYKSNDHDRTVLMITSNHWKTIVLLKGNLLQVEELYNFLERLLPVHIVFGVRD